MGLFDFLKRKKKEKEDVDVAAAGEVLSLDDVDPAAIDPPETRYTQEYQDFLAEQEAGTLTRGGMGMRPRAEILREAYHMQRHEEGGCFAEVYTAPFTQDGRPFAGSIYYLLDAGEVCVFHRIDCDELYYFHEGCGMKITVLTGGGKQELFLGGDVEAGQRACVAIPKGSVFAAENLESDGFTLVSCMTTPQFLQAGCRLIPREELKALCPEHFDQLAHLAD